jgi:predicted nucleic acid-binding protein
MRGVSAIYHTANWRRIAAIRPLKSRIPGIHTSSQQKIDDASSAEFTCPSKSTLHRSIRRLSEFLTAVASEEVLTFDQPAAGIEGEMARVGCPIGVADTMIAPVALTHNLELCTGNTWHLQWVQQIGFSWTLANRGV